MHSLSVTPHILLSDVNIARVNKRGRAVSLPPDAPLVICSVDVNFDKVENASGSSIEMISAAKNAYEQLQISMKPSRRVYRILFESSWRLCSKITRIFASVYIL